MIELKTEVNGYTVITKDFTTWVRDKNGKAIDFYKCRKSMSIKQFHDECVKKFKSEK